MKRAFDQAFGQGLFDIETEPLLKEYELYVYLNETYIKSKAKVYLKKLSKILYIIQTKKLGKCEKLDIKTTLSYGEGFKHYFTQISTGMGPAKIKFNPNSVEKEVKIIKTFVYYMLKEKPNMLKAETCEGLLRMLKEFGKSIRIKGGNKKKLFSMKNAEQVIERASNALHHCFLQEKIAKISQKIQLSAGVITPKDYILFTRYLTTALTFLNCQSSSTVANLTLEEFRQATYDEKNKLIYLKIRNHKSSSEFIWLTLDKNLYDLLHLYVERLRPRSPENNLFINLKGGAIIGSHYIQRFLRENVGIHPKKSFTSTQLKRIILERAISWSNSSDTSEPHFLNHQLASLPPPPHQCQEGLLASKKNFEFVSSLLKQKNVIGHQVRKRFCRTFYLSTICFL